MNEAQLLKLKAELLEATYVGMADEAIATSLNNPVVPHFAIVDYTDVASYLSIQDKYLAISESVLDSGKKFMLTARTFKSFDLNKPFVSVAVNALLDALIVDMLIDAADKAAILSLTDADPISRAQVLSLGEVSVGYIEAARTK